MAMHELKRTQYEDVGDATIRHDTRDHRQDMTHYHVPVMQMHQAALHGWGIAVGLQVTQTGPRTLSIAEGLALDVEGRMLPLAAQGQAPGQPGKAFLHTTSQLVDVPVVLELQGVADGTYYLTIALATTFISPGEPVEGRWLPQEQRIVSTPILTLQPTAGFVVDGTAVILATVTLGGGVVTQLSGAERQLVTMAAGAVVVRRGGAADGDPESGRMSPLATGGLALEVPAAGDQVVVQRLGDRNFQALTVRAESLRLVDGAAREVLQVDATQATLRLGATGNAGTLVIQDAAGAEMLRFDAANRLLHLGGDLDVDGIIRGHLAGGLVGTEQLAAQAVTLAKLAPDVLAHIGVAVSAGLQHDQSVPIPSGFDRSECIFYVALKYVLIEPELGRVAMFCTVDSSGKVSTSDPGRIVVMGLAIGKKGGW